MLNLNPKSIRSGILFVFSTLIFVAFQNCGGGIMFQPTEDPLVQKLKDTSDNLEILPPQTGPGSMNPPVTPGDQPTTGDDVADNGGNSGSDDSSDNNSGTTNPGSDSGSDSSPGSGSGDQANSNDQTSDSNGNDAGSGSNDQTGNDSGEHQAGNDSGSQTGHESDSNSGSGSENPGSESNAPGGGSNSSLKTCGQISASSITLNLQTLILKGGDDSAMIAPLSGSIDLMAFAETGLSIQVTQAGEVSEARLVLADDGNYLTDSNNTQHPLKVPSGESSGLKVKLDGRTSLQPNQTYTLKILLDGGEIKPVNGKCILHPVLRGTVE